MRKNRLYEEKLLVNGSIGGEVLSSQERQTLQREAQELKELMEKAKQQEIVE
ncbi:MULTISPECIES: hypothetical protein [Brevibacillus]|uniref:Uncharacterized protein n=1 Tax=Brevibacillus laterosporus TaxID=1465 RepID=A0AAP3DGX1_BRELA|nr:MULTISPECIES: hypothetical protein [Brevibacillus]MBM7110527.1 hypothetical protein [Brevibacillus laterosporus]MCR8935782.1 hypothetical protein [Brevibacillus laterosporus]MCR8980813.1 hypothetical protein [Brevibacillus laterosporus]MCZ0807968.1 hypothetical protein [Brevibacillus laterosporus]MCZ0826141.1 hypothetical protein [Brevibacillus laterosporus]